MIFYVKTIIISLSFRVKKNGSQNIPHLYYVAIHLRARHDNPPGYSNNCNRYVPAAAQEYRDRYRHAA